MLIQAKTRANRRKSWMEWKADRRRRQKAVHKNDSSLTQMCVFRLWAHLCCQDLVRKKAISELFCFSRFLSCRPFESWKINYYHCQTSMLDVCVRTILLQECIEIDPVSCECKDKWLRAKWHKASKREEGSLGNASRREKRTETAFVQLFYFIALSSLCHFVPNSVYIFQ